MVARPGLSARAHPAEPAQQGRPGACEAQDLLPRPRRPWTDESGRVGRKKWAVTGSQYTVDRTGRLRRNGFRPRAPGLNTGPSVGRRQVVTHRPGTPTVSCHAEPPNSNRRGHTSPSHPACTHVLGTQPHTTLHPFPRLRNTAAPAMSPSPLTSRRARDTFFQFSKTFKVTVKNVKDYRTQRGTCDGFPVEAALRSLAGTCSRHSGEHACHRMCPLLS